jgi:hypothetical protein
MGCVMTVLLSTDDSTYVMIFVSQYLFAVDRASVLRTGWIKCYAGARKQPFSNMSKMPASES